MNRCYATGSVVASNDYAGGLVGYVAAAPAVNVHVDNCYATGPVTCPGLHVAGLAALGSAAGPYAFAANSHYTDGAHQSGLGAYVPTGAGAFYGRTHAVYANWDFTAVWKEVAGSYPVLRSGR